MSNLSLCIGKVFKTISGSKTAQEVCHENCCIVFVAFDLDFNAGAATFITLDSSQRMMASIFQLLYNLFYIAQFSCAALAVKQRFALLNSHLEGFIVDSKNFDILLPQLAKFDSRLFTELYNNFCDSLSP